MSLVSRGPKSLVAFKSLAKCRVDGSPGLQSVPVDRVIARGVPEVDFCKRSVAGLRKRKCNVAYAYGEYPKHVLSGTFKNSRRAAWTEKSPRVSERLARTFEIKTAGILSRVVGSPLPALGESSMASAQSTWRPLSDVASKVLRKVRVSLPAEPPLQPAIAPLQSLH